MTATQRQELVSQGHEITMVPRDKIPTISLGHGMAIPLIMNFLACGVPAVRVCAENTPENIFNMGLARLTGTLNAFSSGEIYEIKKEDIKGYRMIEGEQHSTNPKGNWCFLIRIRRS